MKLMKTQEKAIGWEPGGQGQEGGKGEGRELGWSIGFRRGGAWWLHSQPSAPCSWCVWAGSGAVGSGALDSPHYEPRLMAGISQGQRPGHSLKHGVHPGTEGSGPEVEESV